MRTSAKVYLLIITLIYLFCLIALPLIIDSWVPAIIASICLAVDLTATIFFHRPFAQLLNRRLTRRRAYSCATSDCEDCESEDCDEYYRN